ncbi:MAG: VanW family protein [Lachnospiraceae bacterium]
MKKVAIVLSSFLILLVTGVFGSWMISAQASETKSETVPETVYIEDINVSGMTQDEVEQAVDDYMQSIANIQFTLKTDQYSMEVTAEDLGVTLANPEIIDEALNLGKTGNIIERYMAKKDLSNEPKVFELDFTADENKISTLLSINEEKFRVEPINASLERSNGSFTILGGTAGEEIEITESAEAVENFINTEWDGTQASLELAVEKTEPEGTKEELEKVQDVLGTYNTDFSSSNSNRYKNVENGSALIDGTVIYPGEQFSAYEYVNPFTPENGYYLAGSYENGTVVETYGGGICQVSTTLYNAVILSELQIDERYAHSMVVSYVPKSQDAAISGTSKDLKFTNNTDAPIYIESYTEGGELYFTIYGEETRDPDRVVTYESETLSQTDPGVQIVASAAYPVGYVSTTQSAHIGYKARLWKIVTVDGEEISREIFNTSSYRASNKIVTVGVATADPEANAQITAAVFSGDEATCRAVAAAYAGR